MHVFQLANATEIAFFFFKNVFNFLRAYILQILCSTNCYISVSPFRCCQRQMTIPAFFHGELCLELEKRKI